MIRAPSLMPAPRVRRLKRRGRLRLWSRACITAALAVGLIVPGVRLTAGEGAVSSDAIADAELRLSDLIAQRDALRVVHAGSASTLRAAKAAADHPDWSILIAHIADLAGESITLAALTLEPEAGDKGFDLRVRGDGATQQDVARFVLGLEQTGIFASTRIENSGGVLGGGRVPFSVLCLIRPDETPAGGPG
jgi:hypothetical protein